MAPARTERHARWRTPLWARLVALILCAALLCQGESCAQSKGAIQDASSTSFPKELVDWIPGPSNPIFTGAGDGRWDAHIRERGWILRDDDGYHLWYTGYDGTRQGIKQLGYATSPDGLEWSRFAKNPLYRQRWVEDMMVVKHGDAYWMFAEGADRNHAEMLTSNDRIEWKWEGPLDIRLTDGTTPVEGPCGTPTVWIEKEMWYLFYEQRDRGVWLASTDDPLSRVWINVRDEPVLLPGPDPYDRSLIALNQIIRRDGVYYALYHGSGDDAPPRTWCTNIACSNDLIHWRKFSGNPIVNGDKSSGIIVSGPGESRLYTMHGQVDVFYPRPE